MWVNDLIWYLLRTSLKLNFSLYSLILSSGACSLAKLLRKEVIFVVQLSQRLEKSVWAEAEQTARTELGNMFICPYFVFSAHGTFSPSVALLLYFWKGLFEGISIRGKSVFNSSLGSTSLGDNETEKLCEGKVPESPTVCWLFKTFSLSVLRSKCFRKKGVTVSDDCSCYSISRR